MEEKVSVLSLSKVRKKYNSLINLFEKSKFSSKDFYFIPTKEDWKIIKKYVSTINLYITKRCNSFCKICFMNSSPSISKDFDISLEEIKSILKRVGKNKRIVLMGGEPTVREDLEKIIEIIRKSGNHPILFTNGLKLADISYLKKLKKCGLKQVIISFDGFDPQVYEKIGTNKNELLLKLIALKNLNSERILTFISTRIVKGINENVIPEIIDFLIESTKKHGSIKGVMFYGATYFGRYLLPENTVTEAQYIIEILSRTKKEIKGEYLIEFKKLLINLYNFFKKIKYPIPISSEGLIGFYKVGSLKELIPLKNLKKINKIWEKNKLLSILKIVKQLGITPKLIVNPYDYLLNSNIFFISLGNVNTPLSHKPIDTGCIGIEKDEKLKRIIIQSSRHEVPALEQAEGF